MDYTFRLTVTSSATQYSKFAQFTIVTASAPSGGLIQSSSDEGYSYSTWFEFTANHWECDGDCYPLKYTFSYQLYDVWKPKKPSSSAKLLSVSNKVSTLLPAGLSTANDAAVMRVTVYSRLGASATDDQIVYVHPLSPTEYNIIPSGSRRLSSIDDKSRELLESAAVKTYILDYILDDVVTVLKYSKFSSDVSNLNAYLLIGANMINVLNEKNCSLAPDCASLNREDCSETSHTCGSCLDGYTGISGDSNYACVASGSAVGTICTSDDECLYGLCDNNECAIPSKQCPLGRATGTTCSDAGLCKYANIYDGEVSDCLESDSSCYAYCSCDIDFGGADCGYETDHVDKYNSYIGELCGYLNTLLGYLDATTFTTYNAVNYMDKIYSLDGELSEDSYTSCANVLDTISGLLDEVSLSKISSELTQGQITALISEFVRSSHYSNSTASVVTLTSALVANLFDTMIPGQSAIEITEENLRLSLQYGLLSTYNGAELYAPHTDSEVLFGAESSSFTLPENGFDMCSYFDSYAKVAVTQWGSNPYSRDSDLSSAFVSLSTFATSSVENTVSVDDSNYTVTLQLLEETDWSAANPKCYQFNTAESTLDLCETCSVQNYTSTTVTFNCRESASFLCPDSSSTSRKLVFEKMMRKLSSSSNDMYVVKSVATSDVTTSSAGDYVKRSTGALSFTAILLFLFLIGILFFRSWDQFDRTVFIFERDDDMKKGIVFDLTAPFDSRGIGFKGIATSFENMQNSQGSIRSSKSQTDRDNDEKKMDEFLTIKSMGEEHSKNNEINNELVVLDLPEEEAVLDIDKAVISDTDVDIPSTSFLSVYGACSRFITAVCRHHRWIRMLAYPSIQLPRLIRYLVTCSDMLTIVFTTTIFFNIYYSDDDTCQDNNSDETACLSEKSMFNSDNLKCEYDSSTQECSLRNPDISVLFLMQVSMIVVFFSILPRRCFQYALENICAKRPIMEDVDLNSATWLNKEPHPLGSSKVNDDDAEDKVKKTKSDDRNIVVYNPDSGETSESRIPYKLAYCDTIDAREELNVIIASTKEFFSTTLEVVPIPWRDFAGENGQNTRQLALMGSIMHWMGVYADGTPVPLTPLQRLWYRSPSDRLYTLLKKYRTAAKQIYDEAMMEYYAGPGQTNWQDNVLIQHFIYEQMSPLSRFGLKNELHALDSAAAGRVGFYAWMISWVVLSSCWMFMGAWILYWTALYSSAASDAWGIVLLIVFLTEIFLNESFRIWFINYSLLNKLRPQLRHIYNVLNHVWKTRVKNAKNIINDDMRLVQHISAACRTARFENLMNNEASKILNNLDDNDVDLCRSQRLESIWDIGFFTYLILFIPSFFNDAHEILQITVLDTIMPIMWFCFFILNFVIQLRSPFILGALYVFWAIVIIIWYLVKSSDWYINMYSDKSNENVVDRGTAGLASPEKSERLMTADNFEWKTLNASTLEGKPQPKYDEVPFNWNLAEEVYENQQVDSRHAESVKNNDHFVEEDKDNTLAITDGNNGTTDVVQTDDNVEGSAL
jgi:hypothetical protein